MDSRYPFIAAYILANRKHGTLYVGVTSDLLSRVTTHRDGTVAGFTKRFGLKRLVWFEQHETMLGAIQREKSLKRYRREWKVNLIEAKNPDWADLFEEIMSVPSGPLSHLSPLPPLPSSSGSCPEDP